MGKTVPHPHSQIENEMGFRVWIGTSYSQCVALNFFEPYHVKCIIHHNQFTFNNKSGFRVYLQE
jgi:hypothetical protein